MRGLFALVAVCLSLTVVAGTILHAESPTVVKDQYIVVLHPHLTVAHRDAHVEELLSSRFRGIDKIMHRFDIGDLIGYSAVLSKETLAAELAHPNVKYIEADQVMSIFEDYSTQNNLAIGLWGIDRIDQTALPLNQGYRYYNSAGVGITAYVIDTGILTTHEQFGGRATFGFSAITGELHEDLNGHGTHCAGTIGGITYGVAKKVTLVAVKVLAGNGSGSTAGVIAGVDWVTKHHADRGRDARSVANMSLGGGAATTLDTAVINSIAAGISYSIAAGNNNGLPACNYSPARVATAVTVGASTNTDARASFSNIGTCVKVFAPGNAVLSSFIGSNNASASLSGTSMAAPHVTGVIATRLGNLLADGHNIPPLPANVTTWIQAASIKNILTNVGSGSPNYLLYSPFAAPAAEEVVNPTIYW